MRIKCPKCFEFHIDKDEFVNPIDNGKLDFSRVVNFAKKPHSRHTCEHCGFTFETLLKSIGD